MDQMLSSDSQQQDIDLLDLNAQEDEPKDLNKVIIPNSIDFYSCIVPNDFMNNRIVEVSEGDIISEGYLSKYKLYLVKSKKVDSEEFTTSVSRRFSDFEWLYSELINKYGGYIIPIIPEKYLLTKFNMESYDFSEKRRKDLQNFLNKLLLHDQIKYVPELRIFIEDKEQFISLLKGELEQNKTFEQKCGNVISSLKAVFQNTSTSHTISNTDIVRQLDNSDKELNNNETQLNNLSMKGEKLKRFCEELVIIIRNEANLLGNQNDALHDWDGLGNKLDESSFKPFQDLKAQNDKSIQQIYQNLNEWENQIIIPLTNYLCECEAALATLKRRRDLIIDIVQDQQRIEELKLNYTNSRRDIEMDILKTRYQKNKDKNEKMSKIMTSEIYQFTQNAKLKLQEIIKNFRLIQSKSLK